MRKVNDIDKAGKLWQHEKSLVSNSSKSSLSLSSPIERQSSPNTSSMSPTPYRKRSLSSMERTNCGKDEVKVLTPSAADKILSSAVDRTNGGNQLKVDTKLLTPSAVEKMPSSAIGISEFNLKIGKDSKAQKK